MDFEKMLEEQIHENLLKNGGAWMLVAQELFKRLGELEIRVAMHDTPSVELPAKEDRPTVEDWSVRDADEIIAERPHADEVIAERSHVDIKKDLRDLINSGEAERLRKETGLSADKAAKPLGITGNTLRGYETGKWFPGLGHDEAYLNYLTSLMPREEVLEPVLEPAPTSEVSPLPEKVPEPNGLKCSFCKKELTGLQKRFCSKQCLNAYNYVKRMNPEATNSEVKTLIAGVGWADDGHKRRKYKSLDQIAAEESLERARSSKVPSLST